MNFKGATISLVGPSGATTKPGKALAETGLGYWIDDNKYVPTHLLSGYRAGPGFLYSEEHCQGYIKALVQLVTNWNRPLQQLTSDPGYQPAQIYEIFKKYHFEDVADTAGGGEW